MPDIDGEQIALTLLADIPDHPRAYVAIDIGQLRRHGREDALQRAAYRLGQELERRGWPAPQRVRWFEGEVDHWPDRILVE